MARQIHIKNYCFKYGFDENIVKELYNIHSLSTVKLCSPHFCEFGLPFTPYPLSPSLKECIPCYTLLSNLASSLKLLDN